VEVEVLLWLCAKKYVQTFVIYVIRSVNRMMAARRIGFTLPKLEQSKLHRLRRRQLRLGLRLRNTDHGLRPQPCPAPEAQLSFHTPSGYDRLQGQ